MDRLSGRLLCGLIAVALVCSPALAPITVSYAAEQKKEKEESKKNFEETKRDLKNAGEKTEKAISEGASAVAQKVKKAFERDQKK
jgi:hypothetical protein